MADTDLANQLRRIETMTNVQLRAELKQHGCSTTGVKKDLLEKLRNALHKEHEQKLLANVSAELPPSVVDQINDQHSDLLIPISHQVPLLSSVEQKVQVTSTPSKQSQSNDDNVEVTSFVSKNEEEKVERESDVPSENTNEKLESIVKETPLSDEQQPLDHTKVPGKQDESASNLINNDVKNENNIIDQSSKIDVPAVSVSIPPKKQEITKVESSEAEKVQHKSNGSLTSSFMKGVNRSTNNKVNLSTEILKTLIPDVSLIPASVVNEEFDAMIDETNLDQSPTIDVNLETISSPTIGELADQNQPSNRRVVMNDNHLTRKTSNPSTALDGKSTISDEPVRIRDATVAQEPSSQILYIRGLTRPFSLLQLKELLGRYGTLVDGEFWLDKIKSQCFVTYRSLEEAQQARETLDGCRWPSTNPKSLSVRFGQQDELEFSKTHDLPPDQISSDRIIKEKTNVSSTHISTSPVNGIKSHSEARDWNRLKSSEEIQSGFLISENEVDEPVPTDGQPSKGLDDYFRKTKSKPSIYWLPLTEEQVTERLQQQAQRNAERDEAQRKRESDGTSRRSNSSSRDKRKRSLSPSRRNSKRY